MNTILIVEDNPKNLKLFSDLLQVKGFNILQATSAEEGLKIAVEKKPALILHDIQLPDMTGFEAINILKSNENTKSTPVIALTAFAMIGDEKKIIDAGFDGYISKPINIKIFLDTVNEFINK